MFVLSHYSAGHLAERHRHPGRGLWKHWVAVVALVILQFTIIPMVAMIAADTNARVTDVRTHDHKSDAIHRTVVFKTTPTL